MVGWGWWCGKPCPQVKRTGVGKCEREAGAPLALKKQSKNLFPNATAHKHKIPTHPSVSSEGGFERVAGHFYMQACAAHVMHKGRR